jgi:hypothetical protein
MKSWLVLILVGLLLGVAALAGSLWWSAPWTPTKLRVAQFYQVRVGMSLAEVEALLGGPPGDYGFHEGGPVSEVKASGWPEDPSLIVKTWTNDETKLEVAFDAQGKVASKMRHPSYLRTAPKFSWRYWWNCFIK